MYTFIVSFTSQVPTYENNLFHYSNAAETLSKEFVVSKLTQIKFICMGVLLYSRLSCTNITARKYHVKPANMRNTVHYNNQNQYCVTK